MIWGNKGSKKKAAKGNRRLTAQEQLVRNMAHDAPRKRKASKSRGHAKSLAPNAAGPAKNERKANPGVHRLRQSITRVFAPVRRSLTGEWLGGPEAIRHLPFAAFLGLLFIGYIYLQYQYEYDERAIKEGRKELRNLRHHEQALRGRFESQLQRSRLDEAMADVDLTAPSTPPVLLPDATSPNP